MESSVSSAGSPPLPRGVGHHHSYSDSSVTDTNSRFKRTDGARSKRSKITSTFKRDEDVSTGPHVDDDDPANHCSNQNKLGVDVTRLSFGSMSTQLRMLPKKRNNRVFSSSTEDSRHSAMSIPTPPPEITNHHRHNKNMSLLRSWTDSGDYSRMKAMTVAGILYNTRVTEGNIRADLTPKEKFAYKKFCLEIEDKLEMMTSGEEPVRKREPFSERTLRKIWHLYALYTKALVDEIWHEGSAKSDITSQAVAHVVKKAIASGPGDKSSTITSSTSSSLPTNMFQKGDHLRSMHPVLASALKDPIQGFLVVYGRYLSTGKVNQVERLSKLVQFNEIVEAFFQSLVEPPGNTDMDTYLLRLRQQQQCQQKWSCSGFTGYGGRSSVSMPFSSKHSCHQESSNQVDKGKSDGVKQSGGDSSSLMSSSCRADEQDDKCQENSIQQKDKRGGGGGSSCPHPPTYSYHPVEVPYPTDNDVRSLQRKIQMLDGTKRISISSRYEVLGQVAQSMGFEIVSEHDLWNINWSDTPLAQDRVGQMRRVQDMYSLFWGLNVQCLQRCNHFPGMYEICRKDRLGRNLNRLKRIFPQEYNFFPETFDLPTEHSDLIAYARRRKNLTFIIKPESGCQGKGIFLLKNLKKLSPFAKCVCQLYLPHPFLLDGYKFDQRIYVLLTCVDPLRLYIYDEGIARFATVKYEVPSEDNLEVIYMHLTNYSLNKLSESYVREGDGSKRTLTSIYEWMAHNGYDVPRLIRSIDDIVVKTLLCAAPTLKHNYKTSFPKKDRGCSCFELLGFDILLDRHLNPFLLEVNHSPSFNLDLPVDHQVKTELLKDMLNMVYLCDELANPNQQQQPHPPVNSGASKKKKNASKKAKNKKCLSATEELDNSPEVVSEVLQRQFEHEMRNKGNFRLIYSSDQPGSFQKLSKENYCGYNVMGTLTPQERQLILFDRDPEDYDEHRQHWQPQKTSSTVKVTKRGQKYVETTVVNPDLSNSPKHVQKFREIPVKTKEQSQYSTGHRDRYQLEARKSRSKISNNNSTSTRTSRSDRDKDRGQGQGGDQRHRRRRKESRTSPPKLEMSNDGLINYPSSTNNNNYDYYYNDLTTTENYNKNSHRR